jgi:hypothetical protein
MQTFQQSDADQLGDAGSVGGGVDMLCQDLDLFCEQHVHLGSDAALRRKIQTQRRLQWILALWDDRARFEAVVASGRYLRLCTLTESISDSDERAWRRLKNEILAVRAREFLCEAEAA